jgi:hypothetical protein
MACRAPDDLVRFVPDNGGQRLDSCGYGNRATGCRPVDAINVVGDQALVAGTISAYRQAGVDVPVVFPLTWGAEGQDALDSTLRAAIAPAAPDAGEI